MQDHFNLASLAKLSKTELQTRLATFTAEFHRATIEADRTYLQSLISEVKQALALK